MYGESNMETYIIICKIINGNLLYGSGNSNGAGTGGFCRMEEPGRGR